MTLADLVFLCVAAMTIAGAAMAVWHRNVFHNALSLILALFGVACLFIYLGSEFLAVMEVIIYIGAISIAIIFAIMLSRPMSAKNTLCEPKKIVRSFLIALLLWAGLVKTIRSTHWTGAGTEGDYSLRAIGKALLGPEILLFEAASLILLVAIIGALVISDQKENRP